VTFFSNVLVMTSLKWQHYYFWSSSSSYSAWKTTIWPNHGTSGH